MPENDNGGRAAPMENIPVPVEEEKVRLPETPDERKKRRLKELESESDETRFERRKAEFDRHLTVHTARVSAAHALYPASMNSKISPWEEMSEAEQRNWNERRKQIDSANQDYHLAVRLTFADHAAEEAHLARIRATKKETA